MKKLACLFAAAVLLAGCGGGGSTETKTGKGTAENADGLKTTVEVTMEGDKIKSVSIDETYNKDGKDTTKKTLGADYGMKETSAQIGIGKEWNEQAEFLESYIVKNGVDNIKLSDEGKATNEDVLTGCTINIKPYVEAAKAAIEDAKK